MAEEAGCDSLRKRDQHPFKILHKYYKIGGITLFIPEGKKKIYTSIQTEFFTLSTELYSIIFDCIYKT